SGACPVPTVDLRVASSAPWIRVCKGNPPISTGGKARADRRLAAPRVAGPKLAATHRRGSSHVVRVRVGIEAARAAESVSAAEPAALAVRRAARRRRRRQPALGEERDRAERAPPRRRAAPCRAAAPRRRAGRRGDGGDAAALFLRSW